MGSKVMIKTKTHFLGADTHIFLNKIDLLKKSDNIVGLMLTYCDRSIEFQLDEDQRSIFNVQKLEM